MANADLLSIVATLAFAGVMVGTTLLASDGLALDRRAGRLERRDPATAEALRRAQAVTDFSRGGVFGDEAFGVVCSPSRRMWFEVARTRSSDDELPPVESVPAFAPTPVVAASRDLASAAHVARGRPHTPATSAPRQPAPHEVPERR
ncbi:hypothetical protein ACDF64_17295 [Agromyces sp. MMS24-JH15]|uniref:hypothetical protein n=1 Tax=Agromyces sp. MMS24-JH15 TaxID=3243765 RepID=UPI00374A43C2